MAAAVVETPFSSSVENYLKAIYRLSHAGRPALTSEIAQLLELSAPSVSGMIKRLSELGLLEYHPYQGVALTAEGRRAALRTLRRHRIIESYLVAFLGYDWDTVHEEAERMEHAVSDELIDRMAGTLGDPRFDPHGAPIPAADGSIEEVALTPLAEIRPGETVEIHRVDARDPDRLRYLASYGLKPGVRVTVLEHQPFQGPMVVRVGGEQRVLGHGLGCLLLCAWSDGG